MTLNLNVPATKSDLTPRITVIGVGGAGGNAVNNMIQSNLEGVEFLAANTDAQSLSQSKCERQIQLGRSITQGLGSGSRPDVGRAAAEEALDEIISHLEGANMAFVTAGMGGGTGTGAAPVIARAAREAGILTVGVVTKPFHFEGVHRMRLAEAGITELTQYVDTLIIIPNQNLFRVANEKTTFADAFKMADDVLYSGVRGVTDLMVMPGLINLDFADIRSVMTEMGKAMMGTGEAEGENRAVEAAEAAISNPLLDDVSMKGARGVLINITGGPDMTLFEVDETANRIRDEVDPEANIIFGSTFEQNMEGRMRVSVVSTGIDADSAVAPRPVTLSLVSTKENAAKVLPQSPYDAAIQPASAAAESTVGAFGRQAEGSTMSAAMTDDGAISVTMGAAAVDMQQATVAAAETVMARDEQPAWQQPEPASHPTANMEKSFVAPQPVVPEDTPAMADEAIAEADPFAAAAMVNAGQKPRSGVSREVDSGSAGRGSTRARSFFAKMTGSAARAIQAATSGDDHQSQNLARNAPAAPALRTTASAQVATELEMRPESEPAMEMTEPVSAETPVEPSPVAVPKPSFSDLESVEQISARQADEDLLDIPAFLRRQAN